ncbi:hypothetical protein KC340_g15860 [Hortaea werneckii]|nr:hypothetical protein KC342_g18360 [Hortaea werneckii]KAI7056249.1 hypothetical protein KC339_g18218 [Hortaea werneckii]KAI7204577.1 hypothetical protein KC365_g17924 [Hortaea werneckii]KAI7295234.1 hypothetical protein KC340_g15860 [Hortaea werneckii]KAI7371941.1 hypothetical protein KC328_g17435 [Hortaea werneckii]
MNDPTIPGPGELQQSSNNTSPRTGRRSLAFPPASPPHHRHPSLGELHQELENEQEAQVNRLLHMIRLQQDQLAAFQQRQQSPFASTSTSTSQISSPEPSSSQPSHPVPSISHGTTSSPPPALPPLSSTDDLLGGTTTMMRDETAFYQAETQTLTRENRMLKCRSAKSQNSTPSALWALR